MKYTLIRPLKRCQVREITGERRPPNGARNEKINPEQVVFASNGREYWSDGRVAFSMKTTLPDGMWSRYHLEAAAKGWGFADRLPITENDIFGKPASAEPAKKLLERYRRDFKPAIRFRIEVLRRALEIMEAAGAKDVAMSVPEDVSPVRIVPVIDHGLCDPECVLMPLGANDGA